MEEKTKWGILGPGRIAHEFARALSVTKNGILWGVASRSMERAEKFAGQYGAQRTYGSYTELIMDKEIDVVYIAAPHHLHYPLSKECIENNKPVLCEKPIAINAEQFRKVASLAKTRKVFYMDALWTRFLPTIAKTEEIIKEIGPIVSLRADFGFKADYNPKSRLFNPELGGGSLLDIGIYPVFLALHLLGKPEQILSAAKIGSTGVDENLSAIFKYPNGAIAHLSSSFLADTKTEAEIACVNGTIIIHGKFHMPSYIEVRQRGHEAVFYRFDCRENGYEYEAEEVMNCLEKGLVESPMLPHQFTDLLMQTLDLIRIQNNIRYPNIESL